MKLVEIIKEGYQNNGTASKLLAAGVTLDIITSAYMMRVFGTEQELNPATKYLMDHIGIEPGLCLMNGLAVTGAYLIANHFKKHESKILYSAGIFSLLVGIGNSLGIYALHKFSHVSNNL